MTAAFATSSAFNSIRTFAEHFSIPTWPALAAPIFPAKRASRAGFTASANYTYDSTRTLSAPTDPVNLDPNYLVGSRLLRRPVNSGNVMLNAAFRRMNWNLTGYFTGQRADYNYPGQIMNPGYARFDLAATYNVARGFSVYGRIANLADKQYQEAYGYPGAGARVPHRREIHHAP